MFRTLLFSLALVSIATPASAGTWVTVIASMDSDSIHREYQIDAQSITTHQEWMHANVRICHNFGLDCKDPIYTISAHCNDKQFKPFSGSTHTLRNNTEWWTTFDARHGTRYKFVESGRLSKAMTAMKRTDKDYSDLFNFLCIGE